MTEMELLNLVEGFEAGLKHSFEKAEYLENALNMATERVAELERVLYDEIINPAREMFDASARQEEVNAFAERNGELLSQFEQPLKAIEGEDFDVYGVAYDEFNGGESGFEDEAEFVAAMAESIGGQLTELKEKLGIEGEVTATVDETGEVEVTTEDGEVVVGEEEVVEETPMTIEDEIAAVAEQEEVDEEVVNEDDPDEVAQLEEELMKLL